MKWSLFLFLPLLLATVPRSLSAQPPPRIFFSDLESGPNNGGQNNNGVWVTIWGKGFGADRRNSRVIIGGVAAAEYPIWTDTKITFQIGRTARSGEIAVQTTGAKNRKFLSNGVPFT